MEGVATSRESKQVRLDVSSVHVIAANMGLGANL